MERSPPPLPASPKACSFARESGQRCAIFAFSEVGYLEIQNCQRQPVLVSSLGAPDLRLGLLQLSLAEFHDGGQAEFVAGLGEIQGQARLLEKLSTARVCSAL